MTTTSNFLPFYIPRYKVSDQDKEPDFTAPRVALITSKVLAMMLMT